MKCYTFFIYAVVLTALKAVSGFVKTGSGGQVLQAGVGGKNEDVCDIQKMAQEMIQKKIQEKDIFTQIMLSLQSRLNDTSLCTEEKVAPICIREKDQKPLTFQCTSDEYEMLIAKYTNKKLCHSKIAFNNTILSTFIDANDNKNAIAEAISNYALGLQCVDGELKDIYTTTIQLLKELRTTVTTLAEKLWSSRMIDVLKTREELVGGIFCELRNGSESRIVQDGLTIESVGIVKINDNDFLKDVYTAFAEYYSYFPYFAKDLLIKGGLLDRLIAVHESLTTYRAKHLVNRLNEQSKDEVINNENLLKDLNDYKHYGKRVKGSTTVFAQVLGVDDKTTLQPVVSVDDQSGAEEKDTSASASAQEKSAVKPDNKSGSENKGNSSSSSVENPLLSIDDGKPKNVKTYVRELLKELNIIKFDKEEEPTLELNEEGIKKLVDSSFISLDSSSTLVRFFVKPQATVLSIIQSFMLMTPSAKRDVRTYCKKSIMNGALVDASNDNSETAEEELVNSFASKYNLLYEQIKLQELKDLEVLSKSGDVNSVKLSALEVNTQGKNSTLSPDNASVSEGSGTPVVAIVSDPNGETTETIIKDNVNLTTLGNDVNKAFKDPKNGSMNVSLSSGLVMLCLFLFHHI